MTKTLKQIAKSAGIVFFGIIFSKALRYIVRIIIARTDMQLYGVYNLGFSIIEFIIPVCLLGLDVGIRRYVAYYHGKNQMKKVNSLINSAIITTSIISIALFLILVFASDYIANFFHTENLGTILRYFALIIPFATIIYIFAAILFAHKQAGPVTFSREIITSIVRVILISILFFIGLRLSGIIISMILPTIITSIMLFHYSKKYFSFQFIGFDKELIIFCMPIFFVNILYIIMSKIDTLMLAFITNITEVALYNAALPTAQLLFVFAISIMSIFLPIISQRNAQKKSIEKELKTTTKWIFVFSLPLSLIMILFGQKIELILFGQNYSIAGNALSILAFFYLFSAIGDSSRLTLTMLKKTKLIFYLSLIAFSVNIILNWILIYVFHSIYNHGMYGAALATGFSWFILSVLCIIYSYKYTKINVFTSNYIKISLAALISMSFIYLIQKFFITQTIWHLSSFFITFILLYGILLILFKALEKEDKQILSAIKRKASTTLTYFIQDPEDKN